MVCSPTAVCCPCFINRIFSETRNRLWKFDKFKDWRGVRSHFPSSTLQLMVVFSLTGCMFSLVHRGISGLCMQVRDLQLFAFQTLYVLADSPHVLGCVFMLSCEEIQFPPLSLNSFLYDHCSSSFTTSLPLSTGNTFCLCYIGIILLTFIEN